MSEATWDEHETHMATRDCIDDPMRIMKQLKNTQPEKDEELRKILRANTEHFLVMTLDETMEYVQYLWKKTADSRWYHLLTNYGLAGVDGISFVKLAKDLGGIGARCKFYVSANGTHLVKFFGRTGVRNILQAPVFGVKHFDVITAGIGYYGLGLQALQGFKIGAILSPLVRGLEYCFTKDMKYSRFQASVITDWAKLAINAGGSYIIACATVASGFAAAPVAVFIGAGVLGTFVLNSLDEKYEVTDRLADYIEAGRQPAAYYAVATHKPEMFSSHESTQLVDIRKMKKDGMLATDREFTLNELKKYHCASSHALTKEDMSWEEFLITP